MNHPFFIVIIGILVSGCTQTSNKCEDVVGWVNEAPNAFEEFKNVRREVLADSLFQLEFSIDSSLFLRELDTSNYKKYPVPLLMEWFRKGRGFISFENNDTSMCFKQCASGRHTANGYIYLESDEWKYKSGVQIVDSLDLGNGWLAHVVTCEGCNE